MNTNSNTYTVIYSTVLVVLVAAILAFTALALKDKQNENVKVETIGKILTAVHLYDAGQAAAQGNAYAMNTYEQNIVSALVLDAQGNVVDSMQTRGSSIEFKVDLPAQYNLIKQINAAEDPAVRSGLVSKLRLPVYIFNAGGKTIRVIPCYGAGLWGPIWGYLAFEEDLNTLYGAVFDHKGETPGLGAEIATPRFYGQFNGKQAYRDGELVSVSIVKGGAGDNPNGVDAISGGTITSQALEKTIRSWMQWYEPYFAIARNAAASATCCGRTAVTNLEEN